MIDGSVLTGIVSYPQMKATREDDLQTRLLLGARLALGLGRAIAVSIRSGSLRPLLLRAIGRGRHDAWRWCAFGLRRCGVGVGGLVCTVGSRCSLCIDRTGRLLDFFGRILGSWRAIASDDFAKFLWVDFECDEERRLRARFSPGVVGGLGWHRDGLVGRSIYRRVSRVQKSGSGAQRLGLQ